MDFETLYRQWWPYAMNRTQTRTCAEDEREDVAQEAMLRIWRRYGDDIPESKIPLTVHMSVRDVLRDHWRARCADKRGGDWSEKAEAQIVESIEACAETVANRGNPNKELAASLSTEEAYLSKEDLLEALRVIGELSPKWRNAVRSLFMVNGRERFQRRYGCTTNGYHNLIKRIRYRLEEVLGIEWSCNKTYVVWGSLPVDVKWQMKDQVTGGQSVRSTAMAWGMNPETLRVALKKESE